jgi:hypothetical protein
MRELRFTGEKDSTEKFIEEGYTLAAGILKILGVKRSEIGRDAKMLGMIEHHFEQGVEWVREPAAKRRSNSKDLRGFGVKPDAPHSEGFIEIYAEHGVSSFEAANAFEVGVRFVAF